MKVLLTFIFLSQTLFGIGQLTTEISGNVHNISIDTLILAPSHKDLRYNGIEIPVREGESFHYDLTHSYVEEYSLVLKSDHKNGAWRPINFFPKGQRIEFELYPSIQFDKNKITGDDLANQKLEFQKLSAEKFGKIANEIYGAFFQLEKGTEEYELSKIRVDSLNKAMLEHQYKYFLDKDEVLGLNEYVGLLQQAKQMMIPAKAFAEYQEIYLKQNFDHPLVERAINIYTALSSIQIGQHYQDIRLVDISNNTKILSDILHEKKYTLLDLWAPWCGPCIRKSKMLKKQYEDLSSYLDIVGVVGGVDSPLKAKEAIRKYNYPWENYLEISDQNDIWEKYGISNSGGAQFLIDSEGKIAAINPGIEELRSLVSQ